MLFPLADIAGYLNFVNILWLFVGLILTAAVLGLLLKFLMPILIELPYAVFEMSGYAFSLTSVIYGSTLPIPYQHLFSDTGLAITHFVLALLSIVCFSGFTAYRFFEANLHWRTWLFVVTIFTGATALGHGSSFIGSIAVIGVLWFLGEGFYIPILNENLDQTPLPLLSTLLSSITLLGASAATGLTNTTPQWLTLFNPGIYWIAGSACTASLLALSSKYYYSVVDRFILQRYLFWQAVAIVIGVATLFLGHVYEKQLDSSTLQEIGGSFLSLYFVTKIIEIPWDAEHWPWIALIVGIIGYYSVNFMQHHPQYFLGF